MRKAFVIVAMLALVTTAQAAVMTNSVVMTNGTKSLTLQVWQEAEDVAVVTPSFGTLYFDRYSIKVVTPGADASINALDLNITPLETAYFLNIRPWDDDIWGTVPSADMTAGQGGHLLPGDVAKDTHFLMTTWTAATTAAVETAAGSLGSLGEGGATYLKARELKVIAAIGTPAPSSTETIAQILISANGNGQITSLSGLKWFGSGAGTTFGSATPLPFVPEPATMALLAFGGLTLLRRRRN